MILGLLIILATSYSFQNNLLSNVSGRKYIWDFRATKNMINVENNIDRNSSFNTDMLPIDGNKATSVGIDLGTTNSVVSIIQATVPFAIPVDGRKTIPSVVSYLQNGDVIVGELARRQQALLHMSTYSSVKRVMGRSSQQLRKAGERLSILKVDADSHDTFDGFQCCRLMPPKWITDSNHKSIIKSIQLRPENVSAEILKCLINSASEYLGEPVTRAVITVPAYFLPSQCDATKRAAEIAGLQNVKLLREPEAAALAYGLREKQQQLVLVFDLGGGTFDVSVLEVGGGFVEVIATSGDAHLGGNDFDAIVVEWLEKQFILQHNTNENNNNIDIVNLSMLRSDPFIEWRLREAAENARITLSSTDSVIIDLPLLYKDKSLNCTLTRHKLESLCQGLLQRILRPLREVSIMAGVNLPGDSGQIGYTSDEFDGEEVNTNEVKRDDDTNTSTSDSINDDRWKIQTSGRNEAKKRQKIKGTANKELRRLQKQLGDSTISSFPNGMELNQILLVGGTTRMPMIRRMVKAITCKEPRYAVDPDLAVSYGAAVYAGMMDGSVPDMHVMSAWQAAMYKAFYQEQQQKKQKQQQQQLTLPEENIIGNNGNNDNIKVKNFPLKKTNKVTRNIKIDKNDDKDTIIKQENNNIDVLSPKSVGSGKRINRLLKRK